MLFSCVLLVTFVLPKVTESCGPLNRDLAPTELRSLSELFSELVSTVPPTLIDLHNVDQAPTGGPPTTSTITTVATQTTQTTSGPLELSLDIDLVANSEPTRTSTGHNVDLAPTVGPQTTSGLLYINIAATVSNNPNPRTTCGP